MVAVGPIRARHPDRQSGTGRGKRKSRRRRILPTGSDDKPRTITSASSLNCGSAMCCCFVLYMCDLGVEEGHIKPNTAWVLYFLELLYMKLKCAH